MPGKYQSPNEEAYSFAFFATQSCLSTISPIVSFEALLTRRAVVCSANKAFLCDCTSVQVASSINLTKG